MKVVRNIGKILLAILFSIFFTFTIVLYIFLDFTSYQNLKNLAIEIFSKQKMLNLTENEKIVAIENLKILCENKSFIQINMGENIKIDCSRVKTLNVENFDSQLVDIYLENLYYKKYNCTILDCFQNKQLTYFLSFQFRLEIEKYFKYLIIITIVIASFYLFVLESWKERALHFTSIFIVFGLTPLILDISSYYVKDEMAANILNLLKDRVYFLFYFLYIGIFLLIIVLLFEFKKLLYSKKK
ncbi:MAG: hypothetical protein QXX30_04665 [Candidatus Aenigmatarchaeota archaeon]